MSVQIGTVQTFKDVKADKEQVKKIGEECMEVFSAWEDLQYAGRRRDNAIAECDHIEARKRLISEIADVIQAACNLIAALGVDDMTEAMAACKRKNLWRDREYANDSSSADYNDTPTAPDGSMPSVDTREQLEYDASELTADYAASGSVCDELYHGILALLDRQAAITRAELVDCASCPITERNAEVIAELREQLDETKHAIAKAGGTWTEHEDGAVAVVFAPDAGKLTAEREKLNRDYCETCEQLKMYERINGNQKLIIFDLRDELKNAKAEREQWRGRCSKMLDVAHEITRLGANDE